MIRLARTLIAIVALVAGAAGAHEFPLDSPLNAFVRVDGVQATLAVRAPLFLFKSSRFPQKGAYVDAASAGPALDRAAAALASSVVLSVDGRPIAPESAHARLSLPSDRSFRTIDHALAHVASAHEPDLEIVADQGYVDAVFRYALPSAGARLSVRTAIAPELGGAVKVALRYQAPDGAERALLLGGTSRAVALDPTPLEAASTFVRLGVAHIVTGYDHLLFLLCLLIPLRGWRRILIAATGFTLAHSITLLASALGFAPAGPWFPPLVEVAIAASIVYVALENVVGADVRRRMVLTVLFGLVHGFGFAYALHEQLQFAGPHLVVSLLAFNVGIEIGQVLAIALMLPLLAVVGRRVLPGRAGTIVLSAILAHTAWHWMTERWEDVARIGLPLPGVDDAAVALAWAAAVVVLAAGVWAVVDRLEPAARPPAAQRVTGRDVAEASRA